MVLDELNYMLLEYPPVYVYMYHTNLLFVSGPYVLKPTNDGHVISKVQRWGMYLSQFDFVIAHIAGTKHFFCKHSSTVDNRIPYAYMAY